jgi:hypothetical protein
VLNKSGGCNIISNIKFSIFYFLFSIFYFLFSIFYFLFFIFHSFISLIRFINQIYIFFLPQTLRVNKFEFPCKMSFLLLNPLKTPGPSAIPHLLGRFVLDRSDPMMGGYAPEDPPGIVERFIDDELIACNGELFVQRLASTNITAVVRKAIQVAVRYEASSNGDITIDSVKITRMRMKQAHQAFDALIDGDTIPAQVQQLMKRAKTSCVWMITGILIAKDATIETNAESKKEQGGVCGARGACRRGRYGTSACSIGWLKSWRGCSRKAPSDRVQGERNYRGRAGICCRVLAVRESKYG